MIVSRSLIPNRVQLYASPTYAWKTNTLTRAGDQNTFALPLGIALEVIKNKASLVGEVVPVLSGYHDNKMGWATGIQVLSKKETHIWTLGISNMPYVSTGQFIVGGPDDNVYLGFNVDIFL